MEGRMKRWCKNNPIISVKEAILHYRGLHGRALPHSQPSFISEVLQENESEVDKFILFYLFIWPIVRAKHAYTQHGDTKGLQRVGIVLLVSSKKKVNRCKVQD